MANLVNCELNRRFPLRRDRRVGTQGSNSVTELGGYSKTEQVMVIRFIITEKLDGSIKAQWISFGDNFQDTVENIPC